MANKASSDKRNLPEEDQAAKKVSFEELSARHLQAKQYVDKKAKTWEDKEKLFGSVRSDSSNDDGVITDGSLTTLVIERAARVMSQLQSGRVKEVGNTSSACAFVAGLVYDHDIVPNATSGNPFLIKLRQVQMGSGLYGMYPVMYGLNVTDNNAYADFWLVKPQNYFPQPGKFTPKDRQWTQVETTVTVGQLKNILKQDKTSWDKDAVQRVISKAAEGATVAAKSDPNSTNYGERNNYDPTQISGKGNHAPITLRTEYQGGEEGHWITYAPEYDGEILRDVPNQHKNGLIPIVEKTSVPLFDEIYGLSDFDRGMPIQKAIDSFSNLGYQNALLNVLPPLKIKTGSTISSTLSLKPAAQWHMDDLNAVQPFTTGNVSVEYFQTAISSLRSILLNQNGTTDTQLNSQSALNPQFGKTPQALQQQAQRQNARDNWDLTMMDIFYSDLASGLLDVKLNCATKPVILSLDKKTITKLQDDEEAMQFISEIKGNSVTVNLSKLKGKKYRYEVDSGTSTEADDATEHARWQEVLTVVASNPTLLQLAAQDGYVVNIGAALEKFVGTTGSNDYAEVIRKKTEEEIAQEQQEAEAMQAQQAAMQQQGGMQPQDGMQPQQMPQEPMQPMAAQPMTQEQPMPEGGLHPLTQALVQDPEGFMSQLQGGANYGQ